MPGGKVVWLAAFVVAAVVWVVVLEYLRYRSWKTHKGSGFVPGTQHLAIAASVGGAVLLIAALLILVFG